MSRSTKSVHGSILFSFSLYYLLPGHPSLLKSYFLTLLFRGIQRSFWLERPVPSKVIIILYICLLTPTASSRHTRPTSSSVVSSISYHAAKRGSECIPGNVMSFLDATNESCNLVFYVRSFGRRMREHEVSWEIYLPTSDQPVSHILVTRPTVDLRAPAICCK